MRMHAFVAGALAGLSTVAVAQTTDPELFPFNTSLVISTTKHPVTNNSYPYVNTEPPGYYAQPGVLPGTRAWTHTPQFRSQQGGYGANYMTITGVAQGVMVGAAVQTFPAPNHYQFAQGIAPASKVTSSQFAYQHATTGTDLFSIGSQPISLAQYGLYLVTVSLTTPVAISAPTELLQYVEYIGGEWRDDAMGGQTVASDWYGGTSPDVYRFYCGWTSGNNPRSLIRHKDPLFRPLIGLYVQEPVLTATGLHADGYGTPGQEEHRGLSACAADWASSTQGTLFFDIRGGSNYANGSCVVFINVSNVWFPATVPLPPLGTLLLSPGDPALSALSGVPFTLKSQGEWDDGDMSPIPVPPLGTASIGINLKAQGVVVDQQFGSPALTTASAVQIKS